MSRTLYWKPYQPEEMKDLNKCIPLMDAIQNIFGYEKTILTEKHIDGLFWLSQAVSVADAEAIAEVIRLIKAYGAIEVKVIR